ncbi:hypothetical protein HELRODRAFT_182700 [Helobdella robusta]|uniref:Uncharacterized protein n=1 Tax=Helobdella robusta TaxID=6412 RepID=T1FIL6_HELRO|nr:hypothetical protein HELRODRAFT_182700 [Helobdella robusta]ESN90203.1 hypothetical protein HELRODRAFT_182700 [Helobdella robusta]
MEERTFEDSKCKSKVMENTDSEVEPAAHLPTFVNVSILVESNDGICNEKNIVEKRFQQPSDSTENVNQKQNRCSGFPKMCKNELQFKAWQKSRSWLMMSSSGSVMCRICIEVKSSTPASDVTLGCRKDRAFIDGTVGGKTVKKLLKKNDKHQQSKCYPYPLVARIFAP